MVADNPDLPIPKEDSGAASSDAKELTAPPIAVPLDTIMANIQAITGQIQQAEAALNAMRVQHVKWVGAVEYLQSLEHEGPINGEG